MIEGAIDFEGNASVQNDKTQAGNAEGNLANQQDKTPLDGGEGNDITHKDNKSNNGNNTSPDNGQDNNNNSGNDDNNSNASTGDLVAGTEIEFDGNTYTVSENGDIVDKDGNVFKEAKDVEAWLKENDVTDDNNNDNTTLSLSAIKEAIGVDVTDEKGKPVEFTEDIEGVKNYMSSVIALKSNEVAQGAINKLYADNPLLKQFVDYVTVNGTARGFGDIPDRSGIEINKDDISQQEAIIRIAAQEFGNKSLNDSYIKYLKDSGGLYDEAKSQLQALVGKDKAYKQELENKAKELREQEEQDVRNYWQRVNDAISKKVIGGYKLPDNFVKEVNGQKITLTTNDFYDYLSKPIVDNNGNTMTAYQKDLNNMSDEEALNKELLDAWLTFTGGSYKDLIDMAIKEDAVRKLVIKSKQHNATRTVKINPPKQKFNADDLLLG